MKVVKLEDAGDLPDHVYCKFYRSNTLRPALRVKYTKTPPPHQYFKVMKTLDEFGVYKDVGVDFGDYLVYNGDLREVLKKDTLAHKAIEKYIEALEIMAKAGYGLELTDSETEQLNYWTLETLRLRQIARDTLDK